MQPINTRVTLAKATIITDPFTLVSFKYFIVNKSKEFYRIVFYSQGLSILVKSLHNVI